MIRALHQALRLLCQLLHILQRIILWLQRRRAGFPTFRRQAPAPVLAGALSLAGVPGRHSGCKTAGPPLPQLLGAVRLQHQSR